MSDPKEFVLKATPEDVNTIFSVLVDLPWKVSNPLIQKFDAQIKAQMPKPAETGVDKPEPRRSAPKPAEAEAAEEDPQDLDEGEPAPVSARRVQDRPDPIPRRRVNGAAPPVDPDLAAAALAEPTRGRV